MPPATRLDPPDHPADLVVDVFGTFLGKRSERMVVRWRVPPETAAAGKGDRHEQAARVLQFPRRDAAETHEASADEVDERAVAADAAKESVDKAAAESTAPADEAHDANAGPNRPDQPPASSGSNDAITPADSSPGSSARITPADAAARQLIDLWAQDSPYAARFARPSPTARFEEQLTTLAGATAPPASGGWREQQVPFSRLRSVTVAGRGVTISSDLVEALLERGIGLSFLSGRGQPIAHLSAPGLGGTVLTRRSQLAAGDSALGVELAVAFVQGKLRNQKHQLQYSGKYLKSADPPRFARLERKVAALANVRKQVLAFEADSLDRVRDQLMGLEGTGGRLYWEGVAIVLEGRVEFPGRQTRGALDPINSALNYGYGILYSRVASAIVNAGLELYAGFLHVDRSGKPALVLDLVEEFRAPVVDRVVLGIINQGTILETNDHGLTPATRRLVADRVIERLDTPVPYEGKRWPIGKIIQQQARHLAVAVRGERTYRPFSSRW